MLFLDATVRTSKRWRADHPKCKPRWSGVIVKITETGTGPIYSVKWESGKYEMMAEHQLVLSYAA